jgi:hypothetical protein
MDVAGTQPPEDLLDLVTRFLATCNALFIEAQNCQDRSLTVVVSRAALSIIMDSVRALGYSSGLDLANMWFGRLQALALSDPQNDSTIEKTLKWAQIAINEATALENRRKNISDDADD